jgi:PEP-CTERM motif
MMKKILCGAAAMVSLAAFSPANAADLVTNGGFETGTLAGWTFVGNATGAAASGFDGHPAHSGGFFAALGDTSSSFPFGRLSQIISTVAGQNYTLSYYLASDGALPNYFDATWNGILIAGSLLTNSPDSRPNYTHYTFNVLGTGSDTLLFHEQNRPAYWALDDVSLVEAAGAVPEPSTWMMLILGFGLIGGAMRSRRGKTSVRFA